jgi:hypothetical protein
MRKFFTTIFVLAILVEGCVSLPINAKGKHQIFPENLQSTWDSLAACEHIKKAPFRPTLRVFAIPDSVPWADTWFNSNQRKEGPTSGGYDSSEDAIFLREWYADSQPVFRHELVHAMFKRGGHPKAYFGQDVAPRCNIWPGKDP